MIENIELTEAEDIVFNDTKEDFVSKLASVEEVNKAMDSARASNSQVDKVSTLITQHRK